MKALGAFIFVWSVATFIANSKFGHDPKNSAAFGLFPATGVALFLL